MFSKIFPKWKWSPVLLLHLAGPAAAAIFLLFHRELFFQPSTVSGKVTVEVPLENQRPSVYATLFVLILLWLLYGLVSSYGKRSGEEKRTSLPLWGIIPTAAVIFLNAVLSFYEIELINNYYLVNMKQQYLILGWGITLVLYLVPVFAFNSLTVGMVIGNIIFLLWGMINYFVQAFRGIPFQWIDFASLRTAMSVSGNYEYKLTWQMVTCIIVTCTVCAFYLYRKIWHIMPGIKGRIFARGTAVLVLIAFWTVIFRTDYLSDKGIWLRDWQPWYTYRLFGMESGFFAFAKASFPTAPESYSSEEVRRIIAETGENSPKDLAREELVIPENIIIVMNESFSDLRIYPGFHADQELMPYLDSMEENTRQGKLLVSVKGGTTANTEYEFLTGNSCVLSPSTVVYNSFIKQDQFSIVRALAAQGYTVKALHPYGKYGWNRDVVYPRMGFTEFLHRDNSFEGAEKIRGFVSDRGNYQELIRQVEMKKPGEKLFLFNITMQNHSSYKSESLKSTVSLPDFHGTNKGQAEQYCTLLRISDQAIGELVEYFKKSDQKTLICFFGDHQPEIGDDFWQYCLEKNDLDHLDAEDLMKEYTTRYFIWANYDIPEAKDETLSANNLGAHLLALTGLQMTGYDGFLLEGTDVVPAMNAFGYLGRDGSMHTWGEDPEGQEEKWLEAYKCLIYNELTAGSSRDASFFGIK